MAFICNSCVLHLVTWYPTKDNHVEGTFIQRQVELIATGKERQHIVIRKKKETVSIFSHLCALIGLFEKQWIGSQQVILLPLESNLYSRFFWRFRSIFETIILRNLYKKFKPTLLHLHVVYGFGIEAVYLHKKFGVPFIVSEHMGPFPFAWLPKKNKTVIEPILASRYVVSVSKAQANQIKEYTGRDPIILPNTVEDDIFFYQNNKSQLNTDLQLISVGIYAKEKGTEYLLTAFARFNKIFPKSILHFAGEASAQRMKELNELVQLLKISSAVKFHGRLNPNMLNAIFQKCSFYVCASEWESFGLSVLEALFSGLPVLSTDCGGVRDFINKENGIIIPNDQKEQTLTEGMIRFVKEYDRFDRSFIAKKVRLHFSKEEIKARYIEIYHQIEVEHRNKK